MLQSINLSNDEMNANFELRRKRNAFLRESDWTQFSDSPLSISQKEKWAIYRQLLRDLPNGYLPTFDDKGNTVDVVFPETPN